MFSKETLVKRNLKPVFQGVYPQVPLSVLFSYPVISGADSVQGQGKGEGHTTQSGKTGLLLQLLTLSRTTLVGHLRISVNVFESDFLAASVTKHHQT